VIFRRFFNPVQKTMLPPETHMASQFADISMPNLNRSGQVMVQVLRCALR
jgi:hypothetical protein